MKSRARLLIVVPSQGERGIATVAKRVSSWFMEDAEYARLSALPSLICNSLKPVGVMLRICFDAEHEAAAQAWSDRARAALSRLEGVSDVRVESTKPALSGPHAAWGRVIAGPVHRAVIAAIAQAPLERSPFLYPERLTLSVAGAVLRHGGATTKAMRQVLRHWLEYTERYLPPKTVEGVSALSPTPREPSSVAAKVRYFAGVSSAEDPPELRQLVRRAREIGRVAALAGVLPRSVGRKLSLWLLHMTYIAVCHRRTHLLEEAVAARAALLDGDGERPTVRDRRRQMPWDLQPLAVVARHSGGQPAHPTDPYPWDEVQTERLLDLGLIRADEDGLRSELAVSEDGQLHEASHSGRWRPTVSLDFERIDVWHAPALFATDLAGASFRVTPRDELQAALWKLVPGARRLARLQHLSASPSLLVAEAPRGAFEEEELLLALKTLPATSAALLRMTAAASATRRSFLGIASSRRRPFTVRTRAGHEEWAWAPRRKP